MEKQKVLLEELRMTNVKMENQDNYEYIALSVCVFSLFTLLKKIFLNNFLNSSLYKVLKNSSISW